MVALEGTKQAELGNSLTDFVLFRTTLSIRVIMRVQVLPGAAKVAIIGAATRQDTEMLPISPSATTPSFLPATINTPVMASPSVVKS